MTKAIGWGARSATEPLAPFEFERRTPDINDVVIDIEYCGVCHSDVHQARDEWHGTSYPIVPGHEIAGRVRAVGSNVTRFKPGDAVGVGCLVDSCRECEACVAGLQQHCLNGATFTYNSPDQRSGGGTYGGYSDHITVTQDFVLRLPDRDDLAEIAPLLCAGITTYSPLRQHNVGEGTHVGIAGFGGLAMMGVKLAKAMGAHVTVITRSGAKVGAAYKAGADNVVDFSDADAIKDAQASLDLILSTIPRGHKVNPYLKLLKVGGRYVVLGAIEPLEGELDGGTLVGRRLSVTGSLIGGLEETQEMLDFCEQHNIVCDIETTSVHDINDVYDKLASGDAAFRYVIDSKTLRE